MALLLIEKGAKLVVNKQGKTSLHFACMNRYYDIAEIILNYSLKIQKEKHVEYINMSENTMSFTSLHFAARAGNYNVIEDFVYF
jgi:ankyrin repeat protein